MVCEVFFCISTVAPEKIFGNHWCTPILELFCVHCTISLKCSRSPLCKNYIRCLVCNETSSNNWGKCLTRKCRYRGPLNFAGKIQGLIRWPAVILAYTFMESRCWLCPGLVLCGLYSTHVCQLWKFIMPSPSLVKLHSFVSRSLLCQRDLRHTDGAATRGGLVRDLCQLVEVPEPDVRGMAELLHM